MSNPRQPQQLSITVPLPLVVSYQDVTDIYDLIDSVSNLLTHRCLNGRTTLAVTNESAATSEFALVDFVELGYLHGAKQAVLYSPKMINEHWDDETRDAYFVWFDYLNEKFKKEQSTNQQDNTPCCITAKDIAQMTDELWQPDVCLAFFDQWYAHTVRTNIENALPDRPRAGSPTPKI